jgi:hypothetical protein
MNLADVARIGLTEIVYVETPKKAYKCRRFRELERL